METLTRARYMYIQTYTYNTFSLICLFSLSLSHSFIRFSPPSMFLHVLQATTNYCMSVKAKLVLTNRNIVCGRCICVCVDRPTTVTIEWLTLRRIMRKKERINLTNHCLILQEMCGLIICFISLFSFYIQISEAICLCSSSSLVYCVSESGEREN